MPVKHRVGTNLRSTPKKQEALDGLAGHLLGSAAAVARKEGTRAVVLDMTCGPGLDDAEHQGSPLIFAKHIERFTKNNGYDLDLICVDRSRRNLRALQATMLNLYPDLSVRYETSQSTALEALPKNIVGLAYFDPTKYTDLDEDLLRRMGRDFWRLDILFTRQCLAFIRMKAASHTKDMALSIQDYLDATGKRCFYVTEYAAYNWWSFGFADNWEKRPKEKLIWPSGKLLNINTPQGRTLLDRLVRREKEEEQLCEQPTLFGFDE